MIEYRLHIHNTFLSFYLETEGEILSGDGENPDLVQIFLDTDNADNTGYAINGMGADYLIAIVGIRGTVLSARLYQYNVRYRTETPRGGHDWNAWAPMFEVDADSKRNGLHLGGTWGPSG
ncbi:MAG: hypothetical protein KAU14_09750 [Thermoplasmata archaeon]|nr:hypothetical protein [Thermoplasmata archaeon]